MTERLQKNIKMFNHINDDCKRNHNEDPILLIAENAEYYESQLENLEADSDEIAEFVNWIKTQ